LKERIGNKKLIQKEDLLLTDNIKISILDFYKKWDDVNSKIASNQHNLPSAISNKYQKFTYSVAFARNDTFKDPWNNNYILRMADMDSGKTIEVYTDDGKILPYGKCFNVGQRFNDSNEYTHEFQSKSEFIDFLNNCQELGNYTFNIHQDVLSEVGNLLVEVSISD
jgi:hypothetical protein